MDTRLNAVKQRLNGLEEVLDAKVASVRSYLFIVQKCELCRDNILKNQVFLSVFPILYHTPGAILPYQAHFFPILILL